MDDDDFGTDADFLAALAASEASAPQRVVQPTPQKLDRPTPGPNTPGGPKIVQPTPQALPGRSVGSSILVSPRQKGNPILTHLRSLPWEYSDIPSDYVLGLTTCALFLSLKYHRLHPDYIYNRIRALQGKYNLRIVLTMVDIQNHEESLKELSKTSLVNNVTVILCWSAAEAARYLELYKSYEHANPSSIKEVRGTTYTERMVDFVTVPRSINKTDAVSLVSAFGSVRGAVNARPEEIAVIGGWGETKVRRWCEVVQEPFRVRQTARRRLRNESPAAEGSGQDTPSRLESAIPLGRIPLREMSSMGEGQRSVEESSRAETPKEPEKAPTASKEIPMWEPGDDDEEAMIAAAIEEEESLVRQKRQEQIRKDNELSDGVAAALAKLRKG
ncbi:MAG: ssDNA endonuclease and repair protein rad10 [Claussenomyces sp. TS43310]|nr:MAG: ssDNA endonuclease and repair protein rad10 [Claussenomyces sp. TS43310]